MKKQVRLLLLVAMIAVMLVMTAMFASAAEFVVDGEELTFDAAISNAAATDVIVLKSDVSLTGDVTVPCGIRIEGDVTITGNGYKITFDGVTDMDDLAPNGKTVSTFAFNLASGTVKFDDVTLVVPADDTNKAVVFYLSGAVNLTLKDTVTDGGYMTVLYNAAANVTVQGNKTHLGKDSGHQYVIAGMSVDGGSLTVEGGLISHTTDGALRGSGDMTCIMNRNFTFTMSGGEFSSKGDCVWITGTGLTATITGGTIKSVGNAFTPNSSNAVINISGGTFTGTTAMNVRGTGAVYTVTGGTFKGSLTVTGGTPNLNISGGTFSDPGWRRHTANTGHNIGLSLFYFNTSCQVTISGGTFSMTGETNADASTTNDASSMFAFNDSNAHLTINGGSFTMSGNGDMILKRNGYVTINGGNFTFASGTGSILQAIYKTSSQDVTITNGTFVHNGSAPMLKLNQPISVAISGGTYTKNGSGVTIEQYDGNSTLMITGGTFTNNSNSNLLSKITGSLTIDKEDNNDGPTFIQHRSQHVISLGSNDGKTGTYSCEIKAGTFINGGGSATLWVNTHSAVSVTGGSFYCYGNGYTFSIGTIAEDVTISGAKLYTRIAEAIYVYDRTPAQDADPLPELTLNVTNCAVTCYEAAPVKPEGEGNTATQTALFSVSGTPYYTFASALAAAKNGGTITLLGDVNWGITLDQAGAEVTIDGAGYQIRQYYAEDKHAITVSATTDLTLSNVDVKGGWQVIVLTADATGSKLTLDNDVTVDNTVYALQKDLIVAYCNCIILVDGATLNSTGDTIYGNAGMTLTIQNGSELTAQQGAVVNPNGTSTIVISGSTINVHGASAGVNVRGTGTTLNMTSSTVNLGLYSTGIVIADGAGAVTLTNCNALLMDGVTAALGVQMKNTKAGLTIDGGTYECGDSNACVYIQGAGLEDGQEIVVKNAILVGYAGIRLTAAANIELTNCTWYHFDQQNNGYAVLMGASGATITLTNCTFTSDVKPGKEEGAKSHGSNILYLNYGGTVNIIGGTIAANNAACAIYVSDGGVTVTIEGATISQAGTGCVIDKRNGVLEITNSTLQHTGAGNVFNLFANDTANTNITTITGGTITVTEGAVFYAATADGWIPYNRNSITVTDTKILVKDGAALVDFSTANAETAGLTFEGALIVDQNTATDKVVDAANITLTDCIVLALFDDTKTIVEGVVLNTKAPQVLFGGEAYYVWMTQAAEGEYHPTLQAGADVRLTLGSQGIRFIATVSADAAAGLTALGEVTYGMIIAPADYVAAAGGFTHEKLAAYANGKDADTIYKDVTADKSLVEQDGGVTFKVALVNIQEQNEDRAFAAIAYACVNGVYYYGAYDSTENAHSMRDIAADALANAIRDEAGDGYIYDITEGAYAGKYSKYTEAQVLALEAYLA